jgi:HTH-type transcriptional repressor of NAD biosynthesis genes
VPEFEPEFGHGLVLGKFYPLHSGHGSLIRTALRQCTRVTVQLLGATVESIPLETRAGWIRAEHPTAHLVTAIDDAEVDFDSPTAWDEHMVLITALLDAPVDAVFSSDGYGEELARRLGARWVQVDPGRVVNPVSGTVVRADVGGYWAQLPLAVRESLVQRVVVLGAESTGSTTLARALAEELGTEWVPEYGREHSERREGGLDTEWRSDEFDLIVDRQLGLEWEAARIAPRPVVVCDTDVLATALWHERYVGSVKEPLLRRAAGHPPLLYILSGDEIPFVQDGMRDGEHIRGWMQQRFRDELALQPVPWIEVRGSVAERVAASAAAVGPLLAEALTFAEPLEARAAARAAASPEARLER